MKTIICLGLSLMIGFLSPALSFQEKENEVIPDEIIKLEYRELVPGEIIKVAVKNVPDIRSAQIKFLNKKYDTIKKGDDWLCWIGLDLGIETQDYPLRVYLYKQDGTVEIKEKSISVKDKQFPVKKLWVKEEFVTPPQSVLERIRRESELTRAIYDIYSPEWRVRGKFILPVEGNIFPNFGERRFFNNKPRSQHSGIDIASPKGTPVKASNSGRVVLATHLYFSGKTVVIDHGLGVFSIYCHFSEIIVSSGDDVEKGEVIGKIGSTGRVTGPHLHWSIKIRGSRVDPNSLLNLDFE
ncbi:MAG: M23 family metallopeptidase [Candidatus Aminicenantes bacterium]